MPLIQHAIESIRGRQSTTPRTILGFFFGLFTVVVSGAVAATFALKGTDSDGLIPFVWGFVAVVTLLLGGTVFFIAWKDPSKLMLGQISGHDYVAIRRLTMGDSSIGEQVETIALPGTIEADVGEDASTGRAEGNAIEQRS